MNPQIGKTMCETWKFNKFIQTLETLREKRTAKEAKIDHKKTQPEKQQHHQRILNQSLTASLCETQNSDYSIRERDFNFQK